ncbi:TetR/AcrR family transcriptional regulator [Frankia canadensis]|nr:TetR/AcrR family transcriptional regulator [Frankia canadensis]
MSGTASGAPRRQRADAVANRARVLAAAREVFTERGGRASLNEVAKRAAVGPGTVYRHFPTLQALLVDLVRGDVERVCQRGRELATHEDPDTGLRIWLREFAAHACAMQGLLAAQLAVEFAPGDGNALAACHDALVATAGELLDRSKRSGTTPPTVDAPDLLRLVNAIAWASQQAPDDTDLIDRLLAISLGVGAARPQPSGSL